MRTPSLFYLGQQVPPDSNPTLYPNAMGVTIAWMLSVVKALG